MGGPCACPNGPGDRLGPGPGLYGTGPSGLPGNDDLGTMSAWYVFSALGLYPQTPGRVNLLLGTPVFTSAVLDRPGRTDIRISAPEADSTHVYVDAVRLNGRTEPRPWVGPGLTLRGGTLAFGLAGQPDTGWATTPTRTGSSTGPLASRVAATR